MKKLFFTSFFTIAFIASSIAGGNLKTTELKGNITDNQGEPLVGVKVYVPSLEKNVYTDFEGNFIIKNVPIKEQSIQLSYISFEQKEVKLQAEELTSSVHLELRSK